MKMIRTLLRIPDHRLLGLKERAIRRYLHNNSDYNIHCYHTDLGVECRRDPPSGIERIPSFTIFRDDFDPELMVANRLETILGLSHMMYKAPTTILIEIEAELSALEQLAAVAED